MIDPKYEAEMARALDRLAHVAYIGDLLGASVQDWSATKPLRLTGRISKDRTVLEILVKEDLVVPSRWGYLFGDAVHNLRSILNSTVTSIGSQIGITGRALTALQYPIASSAENFRGMGHVYAGLPDHVVETLRAQQAFTAEPSLDLTLDAMIQLQKFSNQDKHHIPMASGNAATQFKWDFSIDLENGAELGERMADFGEGLTAGSVLARIDTAPHRILKATQTLSFSGIALAVAGDGISVNATEFVAMLVGIVERNVGQIIGSWMMDDPEAREEALRRGEKLRNAQVQKA